MFLTTIVIATDVDALVVEMVESNTKVKQQICQSKPKGEVAVDFFHWANGCNEESCNSKKCHQ